MGTVGQEILVETIVESVRSAGPGPTRDLRASRESAFSLARPWNFPAGHADSLHRRRHSRIGVQVPVEISLVRPDGSLFDRGTGIIRNLSCSGVLLGDVLLSQGRLLVRSFSVELSASPRSSSVPKVVGRILRTFSLGIPGFGIEFLDPERGAEESLRRTP